MKKMVPTARKFTGDVKKNIPLHWFSDNVVGTHLLNSLHMIFPDGERFFIRSVQAYADQITDAELKERVKGFIAQEVQHGKSHEDFWQALRDMGLKPDGFGDFFRKTAFGDHGKSFCIEEFFINLFGKDIALSTTVALEHYTASLAELALHNPEIFAGLPDEVASLLDWHAAEEIEHKSVAYDVLQQVNDSYGLRIAGFAIATFGLLGYMLLGQIYFLNQDKTFSFSKLMGDIFKSVAFEISQAPKLLPELAKYFKPGFHPDEIDNYHLAEEVLQRQADAVRNLKKAS